MVTCILGLFSWVESLNKSLADSGNREGGSERVGDLKPHWFSHCFS
jgi:hypothetical protein